MQTSLQLPSEPAASADAMASTGTTLRRLVARIGPFLGLLLVVGTFTLLSDAPGRYLSTFNLRIVLSQTVIVALGAVGMTVIMIGAGIDLSVGSVIALCGVVA